MVIMISRVLTISLVVVGVFSAEKQIKLEDIEKDNLRSDQQAKLEKQYQQYQQQQYQPVPYQTNNYQQNYQTPVNYQPAGFSYPPPSLNYQQQQPVSPYHPLILPFNPQQYLQQSAFQAPYSQLSSNSLGAGYHPTHLPVSALQAYLSQQYSHGVQPIAAATQQHPIIMAFPNPALAGISPQAAYYQGLQFLAAGQNGHPAQFYYPGQQDASHHGPSAPLPQSTPLLYAQSDIPPFQVMPNGKHGNYQRPQYSQSSLVPTFTTPIPYTQSQAYANTEAPTYLSAYKTSQSAASLGQHQQYFDAIGSTMSPLQAKYLNSPQYLAQNYNTIPSTHVLPKAAYVGVKSTVSPPIKVAPQSSFIPINSNSGPNNHRLYRSAAEQKSEETEKQKGRTRTSSN